MTFSALTVSALTLSVSSFSAPSYYVLKRGQMGADSLQWSNKGLTEVNRLATQYRSTELALLPISMALTAEQGMRRVAQSGSNSLPLMAHAPEVRAPRLMRLEASMKSDDAYEPLSILQNLYGEEGVQYETANRIFDKLCGERCLQGRCSEGTDRAMVQWIDRLETLDDQQSLPLFYVKCILTQHSSIPKEAFDALFDTVADSEEAKFLLLDLAILFDATNIVEWIIEKGVNKEATLYWMIQCQNVRSVSVFLEHFSEEFDINALYTDHNEPWLMTPLHHAVRTGSKAVVEALLSSKHVKVDCPNEAGVTPLQVAVAGSDGAITQLLLLHHANPLHKNSAGQSPMSAAIESIAAKPMYDLDANTWQMGLDTVEPDRLRLVDDMITALSQYQEQWLSQCSLSEMEIMILRLLSSVEDQTHNIKRLKRSRDQILTIQEGDLTQPLCCEQGEVAESIIATGHVKNIQLGVNEMGLTFSGPIEQWMTRYQRVDLLGVFGKGE